MRFDRVCRLISTKNNMEQKEGGIYFKQTPTPTQHPQKKKPPPHKTTPRTKNPPKKPQKPPQPMRVCVVGAGLMGAIRSARLTEPNSRRRSSACPTRRCARNKKAVEAIPTAVALSDCPARPWIEKMSMSVRDSRPPCPSPETFDVRFGSEPVARGAGGVAGRSSGGRLGGGGGPPSTLILLFFFEFFLLALSN